MQRHRVSRHGPTARVTGHSCAFAEDENIHTENSHKYTVEELQRIAERAGFTAQRAWTDENELFSIHYLEVSSD